MTIFGLGNPTERYAGTRHNAGFMVLNTLARKLRVRFRHHRGRRVAHATFAGRDLTLVKPLLYMNESGIPTQEQLTAEPDDFMVTCDDLALPLGRLRLRPQGSDGGHNGLASIIYRTGTDHFPRLRVGIGAPPEETDWADYVLEQFTSEEAVLLPDILDRATRACLAVVTDGLQQAMNRFNPAPSETGTDEKENAQ